MSSTGQATKIVDSVETTMPTFMARRSSTRARSRGKVHVQGDRERRERDSSVRDSVSLIEMLMTRSNFLLELPLVLADSIEDDHGAR